jgi:hypothetical protein
MAKHEVDFTHRRIKPIRFIVYYLFLRKIIDKEILVKRNELLKATDSALENFIFNNI